MQLQPIVYTADSARSVEWYCRVLGVSPAFQSEVWTSIPVGDATLGIHQVESRPGESCVELSLISSEPLEALIERLKTQGIRPEKGIEEQSFGRSILLRDPDGGPVQVNEHAH